MDLKKSLGFPVENSLSHEDPKLLQYINLKLASLGYPVFGDKKNADFMDLAGDLLGSQKEKDRLLADYLCPADERIQDFLNDYLKDVLGKERVRLPTDTFILDYHGLARAMALPPDKDEFSSDIIHSYRVKQGIIHNPKHDRRTTKNSFHIVEGGLPIADDKIPVPKSVFYKMLVAALDPPKELLTLPFTSSQEDKAELFVSLLLRPTVCPEVPGYISRKSTEIRFFAPGSLVSNLDFVESIFGNAGNPYLPEKDAALDIDHWTGHTGCIILAPHLIHLKKKDLGLPSYKEATEQQKKFGMCWKDPSELYNDGNAFKVTCRNEQGVMVTLIGDNYFGYSKKEVKTQISYSSNLYGLTEEEHAGGAIAFQSYELGEKFHLDGSLPKNNMTFNDVTKLYGKIMDMQTEGYGIDKKYPDICYVPEDAEFNLPEQSIIWHKQGEEQKIRMRAFQTYLLPSGYKINMAKQEGSSNWKLVGTVAEGTLCHKPCTVSGGGKSEISKSIKDAMLQGSVYISDMARDAEVVQEILGRDFGKRFRNEYPKKRESRPILSPQRSLGSVIKLFTPSNEFNDEYNLWLNSIPRDIKDFIFVIKRQYRPSWGADWRAHFSVDRINGHLGHELKYGNKKLVANYLRVGREKDGSWRIFKLRQDYNAAEKIQVEDDISASVVVPQSALKNLNPEYTNPSVKLVTNCEYRLFQRPDDAIHRGYDKQAEIDLSSPNVFLSNYQPLTLSEAQEIVMDAVSFDEYTEPVKKLLIKFIQEQTPSYVSLSSHPRLVSGKPTKNPRYLQNRPDLMDPRKNYLAEVGVRLFRKIPVDQPVLNPVHAVLPGRRNNPSDRKLGIPPLAVYNPIHYQELPELFMDFICSVTGKSPSTTGFGTEGALTKGPFNALLQSVDLNNALVSYIVTGYDGFSSAAGYVGPNVQVDHDISLLIPEIWCRMSVEERKPEYLIKNGFFEKLQDFEHNGKTVPASMLGYRITIRFVHAFLGRIFNNPNAIFTKEMLQPEMQDLDQFAEGIESLVKTQKRVAQQYIDDGGAEILCPPLQALIHIMVSGSWQGKDLNHPEVRNMFTREYLLNSEWYAERLKTKQDRDIALWQRHVQYLEGFLKQEKRSASIEKLSIDQRLETARKELARVKNSAYVQQLNGTIGADPITGYKSLLRDKKESNTKNS